jgi:hypothetical protein
VYVGSYYLILQNFSSALIGVQLCRQRSPMRRSLQTSGKARVPRRLHEGRPMRLDLSLILHNYRFLDTVKTSIYVLHLPICAVRYDSSCYSGEGLLW